MKQRILFFVALFFSFVLLFVIQKPLFMLFNAGMLDGVVFSDWLRVMWHGLSLDLTMAGYYSVVPLVIVLLSVWLPGNYWSTVMRAYVGIMAAVTAVIFAGDLSVYPHWGFRLDASIWMYLKTPREAMASAELWEMVLYSLTAVAYCALFGIFISRLILPLFRPATTDHRVASTALMALMGGLSFLAIRGGVEVSTANVGRAYFSSNMFLNHSAVNPVFSLLSSSTRTQSQASAYRYMDDGRRKALTEQIEFGVADKNSNSRMPKVLSSPRPNVVLLLLESFAGGVVGAVGGIEGVTPQLDSLAAGGVTFTGIYANSIRTERGLVSVLNAYPAQPTVSIMKYPSKCASLPSLPQVLRDNGYLTAMYYGGDIDFAGMRSYFYSAGFTDVVGQDKLSLNAKTTKWGYDDRAMLRWFAGQTDRLAAGEEPFFAALLTISSHEPFIVPFERFDDPYLNTVAFADDCIGEYVRHLSRQPYWDNTIVVMISDHSYLYPADVTRYSPENHHIPMIWCGGAVAQGIRVDAVAGQTDFVATLLAEMGIDHAPFVYSRDIMADDFPADAFYTFNDGFGFVDSAGGSVWDCKSGTPIYDNGPGGAERLEQGKACVQTITEDFDAR